MSLQKSIKVAVLILLVQVMVVSAAEEKASEPATQAGDAGQTSLLDSSWPTGIRPCCMDSPTLSDDWFGLGPAMRDHGINAKLFFNGHYFANIKGGRSTNESKVSGTSDFLLTFDLDKMGVIPNAEMLMHARAQWGRSVNRFTGSTQQVNDDADGDRGLSVPQLWYRHHFLERKLSFQIGYMDYQTIVDRNVYANSEDKQFMNAVFDNNPAIPTASAAGLGAVLYFRPCEYYTLIVGGLDAQRLPLYKPGFSTTFHDEAWFLGYMEHTIHLKVPTERGPMKGNYRFGMVYDPIPRSVYVPAGARATQEGDDYGFYCSFDQQLFRESDQDEQGLGAFARYSYRHDDTPHDAGFFNQFWSAGLAYKGLVPTRDNDTLGLAVGQLLRSSQYEANVNSNASQETMYELYYAIEVTPWLVVTPDIQYIDNPGGFEQDGISHAIAGGFKVRVTF